MADTIDHKTLFCRLEHCIGLKGAALDWIRSYLHDRKQSVCVEGVLSQYVPLNIGVPQGSVLGPLLFLIYMLPLKTIIGNYRIDRHGYADDTQLYCRLPLKNDAQRARNIQEMNDCLHAVRKWMSQNKLKLNDSKTECIALLPHRADCPDGIRVAIGDEIIKPSPVVKNLGATIDTNLSMDKQAAMVSRTAYYHLRRISKIRCHLDRSTCEKVVRSTVTCRLDYHNGLLTGATEKTTRRLQMVQNNAARLITGTRRRDHITPVLQELHWLPVRQRIAFKVLTHVHNAVHQSSAPSYLVQLFTIYQPGRSLRSSSDPWKLCVPRTTRKYGANSFPAFGAALWNTLPLSLRSPMSVCTFKKLLKTNIFKNTF